MTQALVTMTEDDQPVDLTDALTVKEFADLTYVSPGTVRRWIRIGRIVAVRITEHKTLIPRVELDKFRRDTGLTR